MASSWRRVHPSSSESAVEADSSAFVKCAANFSLSRCRFTPADWRATNAELTDPPEDEGLSGTGMAGRGDRRARIAMREDGRAPRASKSGPLEFGNSGP
jgi:hypothetical protein